MLEVVINVNKDKHYRLKDLTIYYLPSVVFKSILTGFIFFAFPAALLITITVNILLLYVYNLLYFLIVLCVILIILIVFTNKITIKTLKNYGDRGSELDYNSIYLILNIISGGVLILIFSIIITYTV